MQFGQPDNYETVQNERQELAFSREITRRYPKNINDADLYLFDGACEYRTFRCLLSSHANAFVTDDSVIYRSGLVVPEALYFSQKRFYYQTRYLAKTILRRRRVRLGRETKYLIATDQESRGHFHWLTEVLPRLWLIKDRASDFVLMLPDNSYVRTIGIQSIDLAGLRFKDILWMKSDEYYRVPKLFHISKISRSGHMDDQLMQELNRAFIGGKRDSGKKLYVSRAKAAFRKVLNEPELSELLTAYGFEVIQPDDWPLEKQIAEFSDCGTLVGIHGAGLTNCLFMPLGGKVVELQKCERNYGYWHLAGSLGHEYFYYHGVPDSELSLVGNGCNLTVPLDDFEQKILQAI
jgi:hypothetical protein